MSFEAASTGFFLQVFFSHASKKNTHTHLLFSFSLASLAVLAFYVPIS
jgi:hypothetical protein